VRRLLVLLVLLAAPATAHAEPSNTTLVLTGLAMAPPTYLIGVSLHEGSHALAAKLVGAEVLELHLFPPGRDPKADTFRFGWTYVRGLQTKGDKLFFYIAPKITDTLLMAGFAALVFTDAWPSNRYGQLALTVFGTGLWVDYSKDVVLFKKSNDIVKFFDLWCITGWRQLPARLLYAATVVGWGFVIAHGYQRTFSENAAVATPRDAPFLPLVQGAF
jgi:hypothetical protein